MSTLTDRAGTRITTGSRGEPTDEAVPTADGYDGPRGHAHFG